MRPIPRPRITRFLEPGDYLLAVSYYSFSQSEAINRYNCCTTGTYTLRVDTDGEAPPPPVWRAMNQDLGWGIDGVWVDLDADDLGNPLYRIAENDEYSFVLETEDDLSGYVGKELIGVHEFDVLRITNGASADFGEDRVIVKDLMNSIIDNTSSIRAAPDSVLPH